MAFVVAAIALLALTLGAASPALAQQGTLDPITTAQSGEVSRSVIVEFGDPIRVGLNERVQTVVNIGGDVTIAGTVTETVVTVGGDVILEPTARVGTQMTSKDDTIVLINGTLTRQPGAEVTGGVQRVDVGNVGDIVDWAADRDAWRGLSAVGSFVGWLVMTVVFLLLGLIAAAAMPGQLRSAGRFLHTRPAASLGWGALTFFVIVPVSLILLIITIVGILVVIPAVIALPFFYFFATLAVGTYVVERLLGAQLKGNLLLATVIAVVATSLVGQIPVLGFFVILAMMVMGTGASVLAIGDWRRRRRAQRAAAQIAGPPYGGGGPGAPGVPQPPYTGQPQWGAQQYAGPSPQAYGQPYPGQAEAGYGQQSAAQPPYGQPPATSAQGPYGQPAYGQQPGPYGQPAVPYGQAAYGQAPYGQPHYGQPAYGQAPYAQEAPEGGAPPADESQTAVADEGAAATGGGEAPVEGHEPQGDEAPATADAAPAGEAPTGEEPAEAAEGETTEPPAQA